MRLLFFDGATKCHQDTEGNLYAGPNLAEGVIARYRKYCDEFSVMLIEDTKKYSVEEAREQFNPMESELAGITILPNLKSPRKNFLNIKLWHKVMEMMSREIQKADRIIVRAPGRIYTDAALRLCRKHHKVYLIEAVDFVGEFLSFSRIKKFIAPFAEYVAKREIARAPYAVYVSQHVLQERYPSSGKTLGCSDVELPDLDASLRSKRKRDGEPIIFGSAGGVGRLKGQEYVIRALSELKAQGITNIEYHIAGDISPQYNNHITRLISDLNVEDSVKLCGAIPHDKIFDFYDTLDVYIQPSFTEALGRSVIEAMGRAIPAACAYVGGMKEYANPDLFFQPGNVESICSVMKKLLDPKTRASASDYSFTKAEEFTQSRLNPIRDKFYMEFMRS